MKKIFAPVLSLTIALLLGAQSPARADSPVAPFVDSQTNGVIYIDTSNVDMDQIDAWQQKALASANTADAVQKARTERQAQKQIASTKKWIADFRAAGGKDLYVVVSLAGIMTGAPGGVIVPLNGANPDGLAKIFNPNGNPPPPADPNDPQAAQMQRMQPTTAVVGTTMIFSTGSGVDKLKTPSTEPRPDLTDALSAGGNAALRVAFVPSTLKNNPFIAAMLNSRGPGGQAPFADPQWDAVTWMSISVSTPPKASGNCTIQCKDADSAAAMSDLITQKLASGKADATAKGNITADDYDKLSAAMKPTVSGSQVVIALDQDTMDNVIGPMMFKTMHGQNSSQSTTPQQPQGPPGQPDNNGM
ncbi:MAG TPA: hypothetical protein VGG44_07900 [Tepidisphaeraceae bacterium]